MTQLALVPEVLPVIEFSVRGAPVQQGSKTGRIIGKGKQARVILIENANKANKSHPSGRLDRWRERIAKVAAYQMQETGTELMDRSVELSCEFVLPRSPSHYTKASKRLTTSAPSDPMFPDLSKLVRAVEDAMTGIVYRDDGLIVQYGTMRKRYADRLDAVGGVFVKVRAL